MNAASDFSRICWRRSPWIAAALHALLAELLDETVGAALRAHEDERTGCGAGDRGGDLHLVELVDEHEAMGHLLDGHRRRHHLVKDRVLEMSAHHVIDRAIERRREQQRLVGRGDAAQQPLDLRQESHVGHAIGLVEHDRADVVEADVAVVDEVDEPARRRNEDVGAVGERHALAIHRRAAIDGDDAAADRRRRAARAPLSPADASSRVGTSTTAWGWFAASPLPRERGGGGRRRGSCRNRSSLCRTRRGRRRHRGW